MRPAPAGTHRRAARPRDRSRRRPPERRGRARPRPGRRSPNGHAPDDAVGRFTGTYPGTAAAAARQAGAVARAIARLWQNTHARTAMADRTPESAGYGSSGPASTLRRGLRRARWPRFPAQHRPYESGGAYSAVWGRHGPPRPAPGPRTARAACGLPPRALTAAAQRRLGPPGPSARRRGTTPLSARSLQHDPVADHRPASARSCRPAAPARRPRHAPAARARSTPATRRCTDSTGRAPSGRRRSAARGRRHRSGTA